MGAVTGSLAKGVTPRAVDFLSGTAVGGVAGVAVGGTAVGIAAENALNGGHHDPSDVSTDSEGRITVHIPSPTAQMEKMMQMHGV